MIIGSLQKKVILNELSTFFVIDANGKELMSIPIKLIVAKV
jgi:hypothetical protein